MMPINQAALTRLGAATFQAETFVNVMEQMAGMRDALGAGDTTITLDYQEVDAVVLEGDMIPYITIGLRQANVPAPPVNIPQEKS